MVTGITDDIKQQADAALASSWRPDMKLELHLDQLNASMAADDATMGATTEPALAIREEDWSQQFFAANGKDTQVPKKLTLAKNDELDNQIELEFARTQALAKLSQLLAGTSDSGLRAQIIAAIEQVKTASSTQSIGNYLDMAEVAAGRDPAPNAAECIEQLQEKIQQLNNESDDLFQQMQDKGIVFDGKDEKERERLHQWLKDHPGDKEAQKALDVLEKKMLADVEPQLPDHPEVITIHKKAQDNVIQREQYEKEKAELEKLSVEKATKKQEQKGQEEVGKAETSMHMKDDDSPAPLVNASKEKLVMEVAEATLTDIQAPSGGKDRSSGRAVAKT